MEQNSKANGGADPDESRREFMKKGALASGALALGVSASGTAAAQDASSALVFGYDYSPRRPFQEVARLQQGTTNQLLRVQDESLVDQPDEWTGLIARYRQDEEDPGELFLAFARDGTLGQGEFDTDATYFNPEANLLRVSITEGDGEETTEEEDEETTEEETDEEEEETETPEEETETPEEETETPEEETEAPEVEIETTEENETTGGEETATPEEVIVGNETEGGE